LTRPATQSAQFRLALYRGGRTSHDALLHWFAQVQLQPPRWLPVTLVAWFEQSVAIVQSGAQFG